MHLHTQLNAVHQQDSAVLLCLSLCANGEQQQDKGNDAHDGTGSGSPPAVVHALVEQALGVEEVVSAKEELRCDHHEEGADGDHANPECTGPVEGQLDSSAEGEAKECHHDEGEDEPVEAENAAAVLEVRGTCGWG